MQDIYIITGGGTGIGLECARRIKDGKVIVTGRREGKLKEACDDLHARGIDATYMTCDIADIHNVQHVFAQAAEMGRIACVINSAGVSSDTAPFADIIQIDLIGAQNIVDTMHEYLTPKSVLVLVSSIMGYTVPPNPEYDAHLAKPHTGTLEDLRVILQNDSPMAYNFCKRGIQLMAQTNATEFASKGARILSVSPGIICTDMGNTAIENYKEHMEQVRMLTPLQRFGCAEEVANVVEFLISERARFITGCDYLVDGGVAHAMMRAYSQAS